MKFQTFDEAEKTVAAINAELQFKATFGELQFLARCSVRKQMRKGTCQYSLNPHLATVACMVPSGCVVTYLSPTSQMGMDAAAEVKECYPHLRVRKKETDLASEARPAFEDRLHEFAHAVGNGHAPKRKKKVT